MYVSTDKSQAVVFAFSMSSDHWSNLVPRLMLQGLENDSVYEVTEPLPNNVAQESANLRIIETEGSCYIAHNIYAVVFNVLSLLQYPCTS